MTAPSAAPAYLPVRLADRLGADGERESRFPGTVMVADVAGYARLTAALTGASRPLTDGEEGTERLTQTLARAFRAGLDAVDAFAGEVVYFAGDALICYWQADPQHPGRDLALAAACAQQVVRSSALRASFAQGDPPLHVGLASGALWAAKVAGWSGRFNLLFGGQATRAAFAAARRASAGEVWMAAGTWRRLQRLAGGQAGHDDGHDDGADDSHNNDEAAVRGDELLAALAGLSRLPLPEAAPGPEGAREAARAGAPAGGGEARHQQLLPPEIERRAELDDGIWSPELRSIDCLFLRLRTLSEDAPGALERFRAALAVAQSRLKMPSGTGRLVIDDQGLTLVWVAGEPQAGRALSPDASLALAAQAFEALARAGLEPAGGFASGRAFCATLGNDRRREPVVVGAPMVLAARLMDRGEPVLLATEEEPGETRRGPGAGGEVVSVEAAGRVTLKGFAAPVGVVRVRAGDGGAAAGRAGGGGEAGSATAKLPVTGGSGAELVGRDQELAAAEAGLDDLQAGRGGILLITAPAGMGKSALVRAVGRGARRRGLPFGHGEAFGAERRVPYFAWRAVARALFSALPFDEPAALRRELQERLAQADRNPQLAPLLESVFPAGFSETDASRVIVRENRARATQDLLLALFGQLLVGPQVIALEDLHHMDSPSLQLLERAARRLPQVLFVLATRPHEVPEASETLARAHLRLDLRPLQPADFDRLARERLGLQLSRSVAEEICRRAHGIPLYGLEYLRQARDALAPDQRGSLIAELPASMTEPLPIAADPLRGVLIRSFDGLSALENRALKAASVLGERFRPDLLEQIAGEPHQRVDMGPALEGLVQRGLLLPRAPGATGDRQRFAHALIQTSCYETIPPHLRRLLHGRAADLLERASPTPSDERVLSLAHHHHFAGNHERSIHWSDQAAERARRQGAFREAMRLWDQCLEAADRLPTRAASSAQAPSPATSFPGIAPAPAPAASTPALDPRVRWRRLKAEAAGAVGDGQARMREAALAIELTGAQTARRPLVRAVVGAAGLLRRALSRPQRRAQGPARAAALVYRELARAHRQVATGAYFLGHAVEMAYHTSRALDFAERVGRSAELADCLASVGTVYGLTGLAAAARRHLTAARTLASELADDAAMAYAEVSSALFAVGQGDWPSVRDQTERCQLISRRIGDTGYWGYAQAVRFWMLHYQGETEEADRCAAALWEASREAGNRQHQSWAARFLAQGCARRGEWGLARERLETARALYHEVEKQRREVRPIYELQPILADLGAALFELGQHGEAHVLEDGALRALGSARPAGHAILEGCSSIARVELAGLTARRDPEARARVRRAIQLLRRYCAIFPIGRPRLAYWRGHLLALDGRRSGAVAVWRAGLGAARTLGMAYDEKLLESVARG